MEGGWWWWSLGGGTHDGSAYMCLTCGGVESRALPFSAANFCTAPFGISHLNKNIIKRCAQPKEMVKIGEMQMTMTIIIQKPSDLILKRFGQI